jgi:Ran GTPase-activating protein (RanGAP) involved in mRNA processing and transport
MPAEESTTILETLKINNNLKSLYITFGKLSSEGSKHLVDLITNSVESLQELSLGWQAITDDANAYKNIASAILKIAKLQKLELSVMSLSENDVGLIAGAIGGMKHLLSLKIFFNDLNKHDHMKLFENLEILQQSLAKLKKLDTLDLSGLKMPSDTMQLLTQTVGSMQKLKTIDFSGNVIDEKSAESLSEAIKKTDSVTTLIANECEIDDKAFAALCKSLSNTSLKHLYFRNNKIKDGAKNLPVASMSDLYVVDFSKNEMNYEDVIAFVEQIKGDSKLSILNFNNNSGIEETDKIEKTIKRNQLEEWRFTNHPNRQISIYGL